MSEIRYRLAPGLEIVSLGESRFQLRSDFAAMELSGETAATFVEQVLSDLREPATLGEIASRMPGFTADTLAAQIDGLVDEGVLVASGGEPPGNPTFTAFLDEVGLGAGPATARLAAAKVAIFGLEAHGAHVARMLAEAGVGTLVLADPFPFEKAHFSLTPVDDPTAVGRRREEAVAGLLRRAGARIEMAGGEPFDKPRVVALAEGCDLLVVCWDKGFAAACHWANEAAIEHGVPALFSELGSARAIAGPLFLPTRSACWMCYRMRSLAAEKDFDLAMAYEEHLDRKKRPGLAERPVFAPLVIQLAASLGLEALGTLIRLRQPGLVDHVLEHPALGSESRLHAVLIKPDCPACGKKKARGHPSGSELLAESRTPSRLPELVDRLVSPRTGIVTDFRAAFREASEPFRPMVWRARVGNHAFLSEQDDTHSVCSGKGMTREQAWTSCLGEAVERYSATCWSPDELVVGRRDELAGRSLDPRDLVLYLPEQYADLSYAPYGDETVMAWVPSRSLIAGDLVWVPALAVFMEYEVRSREEFLCPVTSNGLAAGASLRDAVLGAIYEVVERDAFLISWMNRLPGRSFTAAEHPDTEVRELAVAYRRRGVRLALVELPCDHPVSVFLGVAFQENGFGGPSAVVGLGASLDPVAAARSAALEVGQVRPAIRQRSRLQDRERVEELAADPGAVKTLEDHALLYAHPSTAKSFDFYFGESADWPIGESVDSAAALTRLLGYFESAGQDVLYVNATPPDMEALGLFTARVIVPGFQPIWFGRGERRLAGRRLYELPRRLGLRDSPSTPESLNPLPHPIA